MTGDTDAIWKSIVGMLAFAPAVWLLIGIATALIGLIPRASTLTWAFLAVCFVIGMFGELLELATWIQNASPFQHVPQYPATDLRILPFVVLIAIDACLTALGLAALRHRDIG